MNLKNLDCKYVRPFLVENYDAEDYLLPSEEALDDPKLHHYCLKLSTENVEKIIAVTSFREMTPHLVELQRTVVKKGFRRKGLGEAIGNDIEKVIRYKGYKKITSNVYTSNLPMVILRLKQGFLIEGLRRNHDEPGSDEYTFGKELWEK